MRERPFPKKHNIMSLIVLSLNGATQIACAFANSLGDIAEMAGQHWSHLREEDEFFEVVREEEDG